MLDNRSPDLLSASGSSPPTILRDFSDDTPTREARLLTKRPRTARRNPKKRKPDTLWTPAKVGDLDLDAIYRDIREAALDFARRRGLKVIPLWGIVVSVDGDLVCACPDGIECTHTGKHPWVGEAWYDKASSDPEVVARWWDERPESNMGLLCGVNPVGVVVDLDLNKVGETGLNGYELLNQLEASHEAIPETWTVITGSGGMHMIFLLPPGKFAGNKLAGLLGLGKVDVRGAHGLIVAAPSLHYSGNLYQTANDIEPATAPDWFFISPRFQTTSQKPSLTSGVRDPATRKTWSSSKKFDARIEAIMDDLLARATDRNAKITSTTYRRIHRGDPNTNPSVLTQQIITGVSAKNLHPDVLFGWLRNPFNMGGASLQRRIREGGEEQAYDWMVINYRESLRYRAEFVAVLQDILAVIDLYEWTAVGPLSKSEKKHWPSAKLIKTVLRAALTIAMEQTNTEAQLSKDRIAKMTGYHERSVRDAFHALAVFGWLEQSRDPSFEQEARFYRFLPAESRRNPRIPGGGESYPHESLVTPETPGGEPVSLMGSGPCSSPSDPHCPYRVCTGGYSPMPFL
jgi:hypothetical protein